MNIEYKTKNYDIGKRLQSLIEKKIEKLDRYFPDDAKCVVFCKQEKKNYILELTISHKGFLYRSEVLGENMFDNLDVALPKVEKQIVRHHQKNKEFAKLIDNVKEDYSFLTEKPEFEEKKIVKKKSFELDPISIEDAKTLLETIEHDFYAYLDRDTNRVNILYKRKDGQLGNIELII